LGSSPERPVRNVPSRTVTVPTRTFRPRWNSTTASLVAAALVLVLLLVGLFLALDQRPETASANRGAAAGATTAESSAEPSNSAAPSNIPSETTAAASSGMGGELTEVGAATTVAEMYLTLGQKDYESSYRYLSESYRESDYPTLRTWIRENRDFGALLFENSPSAQASNGEATVEGDVRVRFNDGAQTLQRGSWTLVEEGGKWKVDSIEALPQQDQNGGAGGAGGAQGADEDGDDE
ncbi:MAG: hypothetical protein WA982_10940, partial [Rubrobacteraceae bacterium]